MGVYPTVLTITVNGVQTLLPVVATYEHTLSIPIYSEPGTGAPLLPAEPAGVEITSIYCDDGEADRALQWLLKRLAVADDGTIDDVALPTIYARLADQIEYQIISSVGI